MASACVFAMNLSDEAIEPQLTGWQAPSFLNVGTGVDVTVRDLAETVREVVDFEDDLVFGAS